MTNEHRRRNVEEWQQRGREEHEAMVRARSIGDKEAADEHANESRFYYERAVEMRERLQAAAYEWRDDMGEQDVEHFDPDCKLTLTARQLDSLLLDAHLCHAD